MVTSAPVASTASSSHGVVAASLPAAQQPQLVPPNGILTANVVVRADPPLEVHVAGQAFYTQFPFWFSFAALAVSVYTLWSNNERDTKNRERSIRDDFWLRSVLFPNAIEPVIDFCSATISKLPEEKLLNKRPYYDRWHKEQRELANKLRLVGQLWPEVHTKLISLFESCEDAVSVYCGHDAKTEYEQGGRRADVVAEISRVMEGIVQAVHEGQSSMHIRQPWHTRLRSWVRSRQHRTDSLPT
ncbi:hypothetical protein [Ralstonia wenshanensis]|uniref:hypothetical protein n=1 Tax=Ralstonia wenshanensis TaxID=2842456 RepID=UPI0021B3719D|nr:hypothetical protein [Ralstonia wenshanensis]MCT7307911.1 hypothetical protein [Ralstonia wenshanensis]